MQTPNLTRTIESFIPTRLPLRGVSDADRQAYYRILRTTVAPLVRGLVADGVIDWYSFLVHDYKSGVPAGPGDSRAYIHLRMSLTEPADENDLLLRLPADCVMTQRMVPPDPPTLDRVRIDHLAGADAAAGWKVLGVLSELTLELVDAHAPDRPIPLVENIGQFLHYLDNQNAIERPRPLEAEVDERGVRLLETVSVPGLRRAWVTILDEPPLSPSELAQLRTQH